MFGKNFGLVDNKDIVVPKELYDLLIELGRKLAGFRGSFPEGDSLIFETLHLFKIQFEFYYRKNFERWYDSEKENFKEEMYKKYGLRLY